MLKLESYHGEGTYFSGSLKELLQIQDSSTGGNEYWFTDSDIAAIDEGDYEYIMENHFMRNGRYSKFEKVTVVDIINGVEVEKKDLKLFVGGYYDDRKFKGERFAGKTPFSDKIYTYTLEEALMNAFVEGVKDWHNEKIFDDDIPTWDLLTFEEKAEAIVEYTSTDDIAGMLVFDTEKEAEDYKKEIIEEVAQLEKQAIYVGKSQNAEINFVDEYMHIEDYCQEEFVGKEFTLLELDRKFIEITNDNPKNSIFEGQTVIYIEEGSYSYYFKDEYLNVSFKVIKPNGSKFNIGVEVTDVELV